MTIFDGLRIFSGWIFINSLKASLIITLIFLIRWIVSDRLATRWQHTLWFILIIRLFLPSGFESHFSLYNLFNRPVEIPDIHEPVRAQSGNTGTESYRVNPTVLKIDRPLMLSDLSSIAWISGVIVFAGIALAGNLKCRKIVCSKKPVTEERLLGRFSACLERMKIRRPVILAQLDSIRTPMLYGWLRPVILLPSSQTGRWTPDQIDHILCHELAHLKRNDILTAYIATLLQILHWFNPLMWLAFYAYRLDREIVCDAIALNYLGRDQSGSYGSTLLSLLENPSSLNLLPMTVGIAESKKNLKKRLTSIIRLKKPGLVWTITGFILALIVGCSVLTEARKTERRQVVILENIHNPQEETDDLLRNIEESNNKILIGHYKTDINRSIEVFGSDLNYFKNNGYKADTLMMAGFRLPDDTTKVLRILCRNVFAKKIGNLCWMIEGDQLTVDTLTAGIEHSDSNRRTDLTIRVTRDYVLMNGEAIGFSDLREKIQHFIEKVDPENARYFKSHKNTFYNISISWDIDDDVHMKTVYLLRDIRIELSSFPFGIDDLDAPPDMPYSEYRKRSGYGAKESPQKSLPSEETGPFNRADEPTLNAVQGRGEIALNSHLPVYDVTVDPGHGGGDPGAISPDGSVREKDITLKLSRILKTRLESENIKTLLLREDDSFLSFQNRIESIRKSGARMNISIHVDTTPDTSKRGYRSYLKKNADRESELLNQWIHESFNQHNLLKDNGSFSISTIMLTESPVPSVHIELGFLTNPGDLNILTDESNQVKMAEAISRAVKRYLN